MRKLIAVLFTICLVFPLLLASLTAFSTISWALDRTFYIDTLDQDQVYQALLSDQTLDDILRNQIALPADADTQALNEVLRSVITQDYLKSQMDTFVNGFFDNLQGITLEFTPNIDLQPIKNALARDKQDEFLSALVTTLPTCAAGQTPGFGEGQTPCKPQGISDELLVENYLKPALPQFLAQVPDEIQLGGAWQEWQTQNEWRFYLPGMAGPAGVMLSVLFLAFIALCFWYITALIADSSWRVRLQWLGWMLLISALPVFHHRPGAAQQHSALLGSIWFTARAFQQCRGISQLPGSPAGHNHQHRTAHRGRFSGRRRRSRQSGPGPDRVGVGDQ